MEITDREREEIYLKSYVYFTQSLTDHITEKKNINEEKTKIKFKQKICKKTNKLIKKLGNKEFK